MSEIESPTTPPNWELTEALSVLLNSIVHRDYSYSAAPKIKASNNAFKITLPNRNAVKRTATEVSETPKSYEEQILAVVLQNGRIVRIEADVLLGVSQARMDKHLKSYKTKNCH